MQRPQECSVLYYEMKSAGKEPRTSLGVNRYSKAMLHRLQLEPNAGIAIVQENR